MVSQQAIKQNQLVLLFPDVIKSVKLGGGSAISPALTRPDFERILKELNKKEDKVIVNPSLRLDHWEGATRESKEQIRIAISPDTKWFHFQHKLAHVNVDRKMAQIKQKHRTSKKIEVTASL